MRVKLNLSFGNELACCDSNLPTRGLNFPVHWDVREIGNKRPKVRFGKSGNREIDPLYSYVSIERNAYTAGS